MTSAATAKYQGMIRITATYCTLILVWLTSFMKPLAAAEQQADQSMALEHIWPMIAMQHPKPPPVPKAAAITDEMIEQLVGTYRMTVVDGDMNIAMQLAIPDTKTIKIDWGEGDDEWESFSLVPSNDLLIISETDDAEGFRTALIYDGTQWDMILAETATSLVQLVPAKLIEH